MKEEACHPEPFGYAQDKLREGSPEQLSLLAQLLGDSSLPHLRLHACASVGRSHRTGVLR